MREGMKGTIWYFTSQKLSKNWVQTFRQLYNCHHQWHKWQQFLFSFGLVKYQIVSFMSAPSHKGFFVCSYEGGCCILCYTGSAHPINQSDSLLGREWPGEATTQHLASRRLPCANEIIRFICIHWCTWLQGVLYCYLFHRRCKAVQL